MLVLDIDICFTYTHTSTIFYHILQHILVCLVGGGGVNGGTFTTATSLTKVLYRRARLYHIHRKQTRQKLNPFKNDYHSSQYTKENKYVFSQDLKTDREGAILISKARVSQSRDPATANARSHLHLP